MKSGNKAERKERFQRWADEVGPPPTTVLATSTPAECDPEFLRAASLLVGPLGSQPNARIERVAQLLQMLKSLGAQDAQPPKRATA